MTTEQAILDFESGLKNLVEEMYDATVDFERTEFKNRCENCLFKVVCDRDDKKGDW